MADYDVAQICREGHVANDHARSNPARNRKCCTKCGAETMMECSDCGTPIRGAYVTSMSYGQLFGVPAFCHECGRPYPWTELKIEAARDLADQLGLDVPERALLETSIDQLLRDTPKAPAEAVRFKAIVDQAKPWGLEAFRQIMYSAVGEQVRNLIWPQ